MLEEDAMVTEIAGARLARAPVPAADVIGVTHQMLLVLEAIAALDAEPAAP